MSTASMARACMKIWLALMVMTPMANAASLRTLTDVWGGSGNGSIAQGCTTYGPIPDLGAFFNGGGWRVLGGNVACGYTGVSSDQTAATGPLLTQQTLAPIALDNGGSTYAGAASARAAYGSLGVASSGVHAGTTSGGTTATFSTGAAFFQDTLTATSPLLAPSAPGFVRYVFSLEGSASAPLGQRGAGSVQLNLQHGSGPVLGLGRLAVQAGDPGMFSAIDGDPGTWSLGIGSVSGAGRFGSTLHVPFFGDVDLPMTWDSPWHLKVGLLAQTAHTSDASFLATAKLVDVQLFDAAHQRITDFTLSAASGTDYLAATVPEPPVRVLWLLGLLGAVLRRRQAVSQGLCAWVVLMAALRPPRKQAVLAVWVVEAPRLGGQRQGQCERRQG